jgi:hypothetical protein
MPASAVRLAISCAASLLLASCLYMREGSAPRKIRSAARHEQRVPSGIGIPHRATPLADPAVPPHPYMARHGASCMHVDPYTTNTYAWPGPLGVTPEVASRQMGLLGGECPTMNFDRQGRIVAVCVRDRRPSLLLLDPETLAVLDRHTLPRRRTPILRVRKIMQDTSGGAYFYLDQQDRAVVGTTAGTIQIVETVETDQGPRFRLTRSIDLTSVLLDAQGELDKLTAVMPDYAGNYWFSAQRGVVGVVSGASGTRVRHLRFAHEQIQNAFSVAAEGVYVVTDHALYRLRLRASGKPEIVWREAYDRGAERKLGQITRGSGTTPTLLGDRYVAIADNAEPRMNVLVYRRDAEVDGASRLVCRLGVFEPHRSATENSLIGHGRSLIVENNYGYDIFRTMRGGKTAVGGVARIDVREDESGCDLVWESKEISQTAVPKLSTATGLVYLYTKLKDPPEGIDAYYFTAIDFETGRTAYRVLTGTGVRYDNNWASISLAPDGTAFVGVLNGLIRVRDQRRLHADGSDEKPSL